MAGRVGPALAGLLTLGALGGAVVAEQTAVFPRAAAAVAPTGVDANGCSLMLGDIASGGAADLSDTLVPVAAVSVSVCRYPSGPSLSGSVRLDPLATARLAAVLDALPKAGETASLSPVAVSVVTLTFHYGTRADVSVRVGAGFASNGVRAAAVPASLARSLDLLLG